ncbi:MAG: helix-turn-helix domain-containing protein [Oscillospiraceae bacterium]|nr:helix-turn-helix domain-containing protein [Oscillospiraceae bacterium]
MAYFTHIYNDERLQKRAKLVYVYLHDRQKDGVAWPGLNTIARDLSLSRSTVKRAITDLEQFGYLRKEACFRADDGKQTSNRYVILK